MSANLSLRRIAAFALLASFSTAGCSSGEVPDTDLGIREANRYYECLEGQGIELETTESRELRVNKDKSEASEQNDAERNCSALLPKARAVSADDLKMARKLSACIRENGFPDYPDPDQTTGNVNLNFEQSKKLKEDPKFSAATRTCTKTTDKETVVNGG
ncbi:hypothetical protein ACWD7C_12825 [Streptomyces sp. NPDC005134]|uniref:hypothetical protein n=1 Tax=unclassified Streptomyces TaxID=2593676 RepID=UPI00339E1532